MYTGSYLNSSISLGGRIFLNTVLTKSLGCIPDEEIKSVLSFCHELACGRHFGSRKTAEKVLRSRFYWPALFKDAYECCKKCPRCQMVGRISKWDMLPLNPILKIELFDVWGIDFMGPFTNSFRNHYILVAMDYVSKWVKAIPSKTNDNKVVIKFLKENIFLRFETPRAIINVMVLTFGIDPLKLLCEGMP